MQLDASPERVRIRDWFRSNYSRKFLKHSLSSSFDSRSMSYCSPPRSPNKLRDVTLSPRKTLERHHSNSPRYLSPIANYLDLSFSEVYQTGCSACGTKAIDDICNTYNDSPPRLRSSHKHSVSEIDDDNSGAYAKILKKSRRLRQEGEEAKVGERILEVKYIETSTFPKDYDAADEDFEYEDEVGSVAGSEIQTTIVKEIVPPPLVGLTPLNHDESIMLKEAFYSNSLAEKAVKDEERRRVATRRAEYSNRGKGISRVVELTTHLSAADKSHSEAAMKTLSALNEIEGSDLNDSPDRRHSALVGVVTDRVTADAHRRATIASLRPSLSYDQSQSGVIVESSQQAEGTVYTLSDSNESPLEDDREEAKHSGIRRNTTTSHLQTSAKAQQDIRRSNEILQKRGSITPSSSEVSPAALKKSQTTSDVVSSRRASQPIAYSPIGRRTLETSPSARRGSQQVSIAEHRKPSPQDQFHARRASAVATFEKSPVSRSTSQVSSQELSHSASNKSPLSRGHEQSASRRSSRASELSGRRQPSDEIEEASPQGILSRGSSKHQEPSSSRSRKADQGVHDKIVYEEEQRKVESDEDFEAGSENPRSSPPVKIYQDEDEDEFVGSVGGVKGKSGARLKSASSSHRRDEDSQKSAEASQRGANRGEAEQSHKRQAEVSQKRTDSQRGPHTGDAHSTQKSGAEASQKLVEASQRGSYRGDVDSSHKGIYESSESDALQPGYGVYDAGRESQSVISKRKRSIFDPDKEPNLIHEESSDHSSDYFDEEDDEGHHSIHAQEPPTITSVSSGRRETEKGRDRPAKETLQTTAKPRSSRDEDLSQPAQAKAQRISYTSEDSQQIRVNKVPGATQDDLKRRNTLQSSSAGTSAKSADLRRSATAKEAKGIEEVKKAPPVRRGTVAVSSFYQRSSSKDSEAKPEAGLSSIEGSGDESVGSPASVERKLLNQSRHSRGSSKAELDKSRESSSSRSPDGRTVNRSSVLNTDLRRQSSTGSDDSKQKNLRQRHSVAVTNTALGSSALGMKLLAEQAGRISNSQSPINSRDQSVELRTPPARTDTVRSRGSVSSQQSKHLDKTPHNYSASKAESSSSRTSVSGIKGTVQQPRKAEPKKLSKEETATILIQRHFRDYFQRMGFDTNKAQQTEEASIARLEKMLYLLVDDRVIKGLRLFGGFVEYLEERGLDAMKL